MARVKEGKKGVCGYEIIWMGWMNEGGWHGGGWVMERWKGKSGGNGGRGENK